MLKAHPSSREQEFAWEAMMTMATEIANLKKRVEELESRLKSTAAEASYAASMTRPIGSQNL